MQVFFSEILWGSIHGSIFYKKFLDDLLEVLKTSDIYNFAVCNTISVSSKNRDTLLETLINESESAINWFRKITW